ncbi:hypothetical protein CDD81_7859 [Ophiocordyceps australis]|uniref:Ribophorin II C-terminal domain-containing protein n=1 Tax=Ophiocordyceps australis TaxID=1399860 RepID=A0A2C5YEY2_9HYPO|nr:hypothetical protein CDD81_7859 [Ophiocordyceps australis]
MRFLTASVLVAAAAGTVRAVTSWDFSDASATVTSKKDDDVVQSFTSSEQVKQTITLGYDGALKLSLTTKEGTKPKRPHQAFLMVKEPSSGLETSFPLKVKDSGKATAQIALKDLPVQLLLSPRPLEASLVIGSTGSAVGLLTPVFDIALKHDPSAQKPSYEYPERYKRLEEIYHTFGQDPKSPPKAISMVFVLAVLGAVPALAIGWLFVGANASHAKKALGDSPLSHVMFFGSIVAMETVFWLYYRNWNLFQALPAMSLVGLVALLSGTRALGEVQRRRLAGER